jgi:hypothetical protein
VTVFKTQPVQAWQQTLPLRRKLLGQWQKPGQVGCGLK